MDLESNRIITSEEIPPIPEPEFSSLRGEILKLLYPNMVDIDLIKVSLGESRDVYHRVANKPWSDEHDVQLR